MKIVKILDNNFAHGEYISDFQKSKYIKWDRNLNNYSGENIIVTDNFLSLPGLPNNSTAILLEPKSINPNIYKYVSENNDKFKNVLTYDKDLLDLGQNFKFYPFGGCWIRPEEQMVYPKKKLLSIIVSEKKSTSGHILRHEIVDKFKDKIDIFGRGYNPIENKLEALKDYMFSIVIENEKSDYFFSEKLNDCFATGTIPIYWGCPSIKDFFDSKGIIEFDDIGNLSDILMSLSESQYLSKIENVNNNFNISKKFLLAEDWIFENYNIF